MWFQREQQDLVASLRAAGPDAPTLCEGWSTRHLAAHLYLRGHRPWRLLPDSDAAVAHLAGELRHDAAYEDLLTAFAAPARLPNPMALLPGPAREAFDLVEYVVHHEDVRRAGTSPAAPRRLEPGLRDAVWSRLRQLTTLAYRGCPVGVVLVTPGGPRRVVRTRPVSVAVVGEPVEQALYATGRRDRAHVHLEGDGDAVRAFEQWAG